ncbi:MAG: hypothetical protein HYY18_09650 [Planctomycetes bacterium]|nr:hypothetical protein [Planctomycetota bacterium]
MKISPSLAGIALVAGVLGATAGFLAGRLPGGANEETLTERQLTAADGSGVVESGESESAALQQKLKSAEAELERLRAGISPPATELGEMRRRIDPLVEAKEGRALLRLMASFASRGEPGRADAIAIWLKLLDPEGDFGLSSGDLEEALHHWMPDFVEWALRNPSLAPSECRESAAASLEESEADPKEILRLLNAEKDGKVAGSIARALDATEEMIPELEAAIRVHAENQHAVYVLVHRIAWLRKPSSLASLRKLASDPSPIVREEAQVQIQRHDPLATGLFLDYAVKYSKTLGPMGVLRGDILVAIGDTLLTSLESWKQQVVTLQSSDEIVMVTINRAGSTLSFHMKGRDVAEINEAEFVVRRR